MSCMPDPCNAHVQASKKQGGDILDTHPFQSDAVDAAGEMNPRKDGIKAAADNVAPITHNADAKATKVGISSA